MPYAIRHEDGGFAVFNEDTGETVPGGRHETRADATEHMQALYANVKKSGDDLNEQRYVLGIAYQAGRQSSITKGQDGHRDYFTHAELEKAAWKFLADGPREVGLFHMDGTEGHATVVESYVYRGPDWTVGDTVVKSGDWLMGAILDDVAWGLYKDGRISGFSPQGTATRRRRRS